MLHQFCIRVILFWCSIFHLPKNPLHLLHIHLSVTFSAPHYYSSLNYSTYLPPSRLRLRHLHSHEVLHHVLLSTELLTSISHNHADLKPQGREAGIPFFLLQVVTSFCLSSSSPMLTLLNTLLIFLLF